MATLKRLLTRPEEVTHDRLRAVVDGWGARVFTKLRVADVLAIESSGIHADAFRFALQSHFDFVVADADLQPLFAVEYDGPFHADLRQRRRDALKTRLCDRFGLPLLRIRETYLDPATDRMDVLSWCVHAWFSTRVVDDAIAAGQIEPGDVDPLDFSALPGTEGDADDHLPLWIARNARAEIWDIAQRRPGMDPVVSHFVERRPSGALHAVVWVRLDPHTALYSVSGMRPQQFPVALEELVEDLATLDLRRRLGRLMAGKLPATPIADLREILERFAGRNRMLSSGGVLSSLTAAVAPPWGR